MESQQTQRNPGGFLHTMKSLLPEVMNNDLISIIEKSTGTNVPKNGSIINHLQPKSTYTSKYNPYEYWPKLAEKYKVARAFFQDQETAAIEIFLAEFTDRHPLAARFSLMGLRQNDRAILYHAAHDEQIMRPTYVGEYQETGSNE